MSSQPWMLRPAVWATAPSSACVSCELGVVVDIEKLSFYSGGTYIVVRDSLCLIRVAFYDQYARNLVSTSISLQYSMWGEYCASGKEALFHLSSFQFRTFAQLS